jgi:hypothetical protein
MLGRRRPNQPDPALLARVTDVTEVDLGTYPEDVLAVTGAYPARRTLDRKPDHPSPFRRLDTHARQAAMQSALDRLIAEGTLDVAPGSSLERVVTDGLDGKLAVNGPLADLYRLAFWIHRKGFRAGLIVIMDASDGLEGAAMPAGVPPAGLENCFGLTPAGNEDMSVLLVERVDNETGTRTYTLRTPRGEFARMAAFLFAGVRPQGEALVITKMQFRIGQARLRVDADFLRKDTEDLAHGRLTMRAQSGRRKKQQEPHHVKVSSDAMVEVLTKQFVSTAARTQ